MADKTKGNGIGRACGTCGRKQMHVQGFGLENLKERAGLGRPGRRWEDNMKLDLKEIG